MTVNFLVDSISLIIVLTIVTILYILFGLCTFYFRKYPIIQVREPVVLVSQSLASVGSMLFYIIHRIHENMGLKTTVYCDLYHFFSLVAVMAYSLRMVLLAMRYSEKHRYNRLFSWITHHVIVTINIVIFVPAGLTVLGWLIQTYDKGIPDHTYIGTWEPRPFYITMWLVLMIPALVAIIIVVRGGHDLYWCMVENSLFLVANLCLTLIFMYFDDSMRPPDFFIDILPLILFVLNPTVFLGLPCSLILMMKAGIVKDIIPVTPPMAIFTFTANQKKQARLILPAITARTRRASNDTILSSVVTLREFYHTSVRRLKLPPMSPASKNVPNTSPDSPKSFLLPPKDENLNETSLDGPPPGKTLLPGEITDESKSSTTVPFPGANKKFFEIQQLWTHLELPLANNEKVKSILFILMDPVLGAALRKLMRNQFAIENAIFVEACAKYLGVCYNLVRGAFPDHTTNPATSQPTGQVPLSALTSSVDSFNRLSLSDDSDLLLKMETMAIEIYHSALDPESRFSINVASSFRCKFMDKFSVYRDLPLLDRITVFDCILIDVCELIRTNFTDFVLKWEN